MAPSSPILSPSRSPLSGGRVNGDNASVNERTALQSGMLGERKDSGVRKDSLTREKKGKMPVLSHLLNVGNGTVLSLAADEKYVYAGCQSADNEITVFSRSSLQPLYRLLGHQGSVLALLIVEEKKWLVSSSSAGDVRIWSTETLDLLYVIHPCDDTSGDIYSLAWDERAGGTLYFGSQSCSIEWINFSDLCTFHQRKISGSAAGTVHVVPNGIDSSSRPGPSQRSGRYKPHKFFDNPPENGCSGSSTPCSPFPSNTARKETFSKAELDQVSVNLLEQTRPATEIEVPAESRLAFAHYGYVYALHTLSRPNGDKWLVSGSGDSDVKIWECHPSGGITLIRQFNSLSGAVLSFAFRDDLLYAGLQAGEIAVWDLETGACIRTIEAHEEDVLVMSALGGDVYTAAADGRVLRVNDEFDCTAAFKAHSGTVMSSTIVKSVKGDSWELITGGNDSYVKIWQVEASKETLQSGNVMDMEHEGDVMLYALSKLVAVPTISDDSHRESCRQGAHLLKKILSQLGASSEVLCGEQGKNPLVLATFTGRDIGKPRKRLLFYGHYDVQPAAEKRWITNPWELSGRNGYLYGRGVTDNKGPIMAVACAAASLRQRRELDVDLVMIIEGEEEAGSRGFASTVRAHKVDIGHIDAILLSNSTWIDEEDPCVVFGMRGVVYANLSVESNEENLHNGVDGGASSEPMFDMVRVLAALSDAKGVKVPGFYDSVRPATNEEMSLLRDVSSACGRPLDELIRVWRQPSFSIASINSSGSGNKTVIPRKVSTDISMRIVPDQDLETIVKGLKQFCRDTFQGLGSPNTFKIQVTHTASWWLASLESPYFKALEASVQDVWGVKPLKIREGGTVPTVFWLEKEFGAPCVHLPLGQSSDAGHLANERMRLLNLRNGKRVIEAYLTRLASI
ncbi:di- and tripeptidase [Cryptococcus neoformans C23]|uniref:Di-and tripeptidase n=1 Tax=Cryptococcus neoformans (strain H99 / ATCC 208821 / CBS 10515 / FGSC 9487) TaxID=235443 RepID=J9VNU2_CRYN9|nr:di- and tripeptidase [Cryptococcus neoformans var. grubii H99]AUB25747.1 di- and tripeptidase [Cryptococcus neoformans var. grubii]OWZ30903.1 di- and tripeptidase [Cryptococcus neoformans var. grubii AD2-60a]OWZ42958.1 di- and tripeptidase [Cryptococcus neoformans var. grubii C23]OXC83977.1 di- and tripeptidase [Cryptococcus neoformans var. grubii AD1-7a]OXG40138.1 di- and tripeptidase [Cryptococcus neoformans var. grubii Bt120]OXG79080.1 di- and tripeptidase [Cryptococcus neoformans var. |eukprot:XP_012050288.1 di- and tripeptidase [Cryptococcus neoformans var. grubii H99]